MKKIIVIFLFLNSFVATAQVYDVAPGINHFAFELYRKNANQKGNFIFSPFSIEAVMSMVAAGARGETLKQMNKTLHIDENAPADFKKILPLLNGNKNFQLSTANRLWGSAGLSYELKYLGVLRDNYLSELTSLDIRNKTEEARAHINKWVEEQTQNKIQNFIEKGVLTPSTNFVLTNAIYFKADWSKKFSKNETFDTSFYVTPKNIKKVPMMNMTSVFNYTETSEFQILELSYAGDEVVMDIVLPNEKTDFSKFENKMGPNLIFENGLRQAEVVVSVPKLKLDTKIDISKQLSKLGMPLVFDKSKADLQGIIERKKNQPNLYLDKVIHQATVNVDEGGTEAVAATAAVAKRAGVATHSDNLKYFVANRPYIFFIRHIKTGIILFMGRVSEP